MLSIACDLAGQGLGALAAGAGLLAVALMLALLVDLRWGEPPAALHPVVWMGRYLGACGRLTTRLPPAAAFVAGALTWCVGAVAVGAAAWAAQHLALAWTLQFLAQVVAEPWTGGSTELATDAPAWLGLQEAGAAALTALLMAGLLKSMFSWRMLQREAAAVEAALQQSLAQGRERLSWLVSRDTSQLSAAGVRESAIESLAENFNDSVVAPIFWCLVFGLPGAAIYRFANTADAMWGYRGTYRGHHWEWAGKWAARADDVLSWLPARLTAALWRQAAPAGRRPAWPAIATEAARTPSPNSGWPMAVAALALGVGLGKPGVYRLLPEGRQPEADDMAAALKLAARAMSLTVRLACGGLILLGAGLGLAWML